MMLVAYSESMSVVHWTASPICLTLSTLFKLGT
jgi:hypothetical protein